MVVYIYIRQRFTIASLVEAPNLTSSHAYYVRSLTLKAAALTCMHVCAQICFVFKTVRQRKTACMIDREEEEEEN